MYCLIAAGCTAAVSDLKFSLLVTCALQQALKVAYSGKLPSESRTWVAAYTATVLLQLIRLQTDPQMLCTVIIGLFQQSADAAAQFKPPGTTTPHVETMTGPTTAQHGSARASLDPGTAEHAAVLQLPLEAMTLASLYNLATSVLHKWQGVATSTWGGSQSISAPDVSSKEPSNGSIAKKRKHAKQAADTAASTKKQRTAAKQQLPPDEALESLLKVWLHSTQKHQTHQCIL